MGYLVLTRSDGKISVRVGVGAGDDHAAHAAHWESKPKQIANGWAVVSFAYSEADPRPGDRAFRDAWEDDTGGGIRIPITKARIVAQKIMARLVRQEIGLLEERRTLAEMENDTTLVGQIDARKTNLQSSIIPQIRDGIIAAVSIAELKAVRQTYLAGRPPQL